MISFIAKFCQCMKTAAAAVKSVPAAGISRRAQPVKNQTAERAGEALLYSERLQIERKQFFFELKENASGQFLRMTEDVGGRRDTIIVPATGLTAFRDAVARADAAIGGSGGN